MPLNKQFNIACWPFNKYFKCHIFDTVHWNFIIFFREFIEMSIGVYTILGYQLSIEIYWAFVMLT